ncbi:hypothetical protein [uncultured Aquimarina sp.]|uniref:hypothetical protein n=1 Tax=uncultured Aquimarina sp. TaxID=575652 RepID=UPI0026241531|nr:hypothetical protein [uncultured Aquimarina sp.]
MDIHRVKYIIDHYLHLALLEVTRKLKYPYLTELELEIEKEKISELILKDYKDKIFLNNCPKCGELARTPKARQCRYCGNKWFE